MTRFLAVFLVILLVLPRVSAADNPLVGSSAAPVSSGISTPAILEIRVIEGENEIYAVGSRATRGVTVIVTDETGHPVSGATVSFILPSSGTGGTFFSGGKSEIATTQADGRATVWGMQWNRLAGRFEIRITAVKGQARAGTVSAEYLSDIPEAAPASPDVHQADVHQKNILPGPSEAAGVGKHGGRKWLWIALVAGGAAAAGGIGLARRSSSSSTAQAGITIGTPTIVLGHP